MISHMIMSHDHHGKVVHRPSRIGISSVLKSSENSNEFSLSNSDKEWDCVRTRGTIPDPLRGYEVKTRRTRQSSLYELPSYLYKYM